MNNKSKPWRKKGKHLRALKAFHGEQAKYTLQDLLIPEEQTDRSLLKEAGRRAAFNAINENKAMGIPITFLRDGWVVRKMPDDTIVKVKQILTSDIKTRDFKKGTVLHVKKTNR
ncbi:MAG TPA: hypothetical protein VM802_07715 [Chitinophaga sp.]|uniref:hypothetical protein n=1 Tax=Chitinophaga sp. TaxID=1869181 RepID=UPI002C96DAEA|nr:hypothetical protein [Chitinophaga sp.]HVI44740.1 hypothetical protein [Chitinophaga sp.]